jgi:hypothetical protein
MSGSINEQKINEQKINEQTSQNRTLLLAVGSLTNYLERHNAIESNNIKHILTVDKLFGILDVISAAVELEPDLDSVALQKLRDCFAYMKKDANEIMSILCAQVRSV